MEAPPAGVTEAGAPAFAVLVGPSLGLRTAPSGLGELPDGRIAVIGTGEMALGDGAHWTNYELEDPATARLTGDVVAMRDGRLFTGVVGGVGEIQFTAAGRLRVVPAALAPVDSPAHGVPYGRAFAVGSRWFWFSSSGPVLEWAPGEPPRVLDALSNPTNAFQAGGLTFISDSKDGLFAVREGRLVAHPVPGFGGLAEAVIASAPWDENRVLLGTTGRGLFLFDGQRATPLPLLGLGSVVRRVTDLGVISDTLFAATIDSTGVVFFDRAGRVTQVVDRAFDHRLVSARRLRPTRHGVLWAMLNSEIVRVDQASRLTQMAPLAPTAMDYAAPVRHAGRLWMLSDGVVLRGVYTEDGRLLRFEEKTAPDNIFHLGSHGGRLLALGQRAWFQWDGQDWQEIFAGVRDAILLRHPAADGRWFYAAFDEVGWVRFLADGGLAVERHPVPGLGSIYSMVPMTDGTIWTERGVGRVARIEPGAVPPRVDLIGQAHGLPAMWTQVWSFDGAVRLAAHDGMSRYDAATGRFTSDVDFNQRYPGLNGFMGRPGRDAFGRLWLAADDTVRVFDPRLPAPGAVAELFPEGLHPGSFVFQDDGVTWLLEPRQMLRYDPRVAVPELPPLRTFITEVHLPEAGRHLFGRELINELELSYAENSIEVRFATPHNPAGGTLVHETWLDGLSAGWTRASAGDRVSFNRLGEGSYRLRVRPVYRGLPGAEAVLALTVAPPWYRTLPAYLSYVVAGIAVVLGAAVGVRRWERRDRQRLEKLVSQRTADLDGANKRLVQLVREANAAAEAKSSFLAAMSHEIRTPLNGVIAMAGTLREMPMPAEQRECVEIVHRSGQLVVSLINDILDYSRLEAGKLQLEPAEVDLRELVDEVVELLLPAAREKALSLVWSLDAAVPAWVIVDPVRLKQVLVNLVGNAVKFTLRGSVTVRGTAVPERPGCVQFSVHDTGVGIAREHLTRLFQPFEQAEATNRRRFGGTGLGLVISKRICAQLGGAIAVESTPGVGSTFSFVVQAPAASVDTRRGSPGSATSTTEATHRHPVAAVAVVIADPAKRDYLAAAVVRAGFAPVALRPEEWTKETRRDWAAVWVEAEADGQIAQPVSREAWMAGEDGTKPPRWLALLPLGRTAGATGVDASLAQPFSHHQVARLLEPVATAMRPVLEAGGAEGSERVAPEAEPPLRVLVVDDNPTNLRVAQLFLRRLGHDVSVATGGQEAIERVGRESFDVVLMDVQMPEIDGHEATRRIRATVPAEVRPWIIACTAGALEGDRMGALAAGMDDYLAKPLVLDRARVALARVRERRAMLRGEASGPVGAPAAG